MWYLWYKITATINDIQNKKDFLNATSDKKLDEALKKYNIKVRDHGHITGKYLGPAHYECNLNRNYKNNTSIFS